MPALLVRVADYGPAEAGHHVQPKPDTTYNSLSTCGRLTLRLS
jgi:hypothetical protein